MVHSICDKLRAFETDRTAVYEAIASDATKSDDERKIALAIVGSANAKLEALTVIDSDIDHHFHTFIKPLNPFNVADAFDKTAGIVPRDDADRSRATNKVRMRVANAFGKESGLPAVAIHVTAVR